MKYPIFTRSLKKKLNTGVLLNMLTEHTGYISGDGGRGGFCNIGFNTLGEYFADVEIKTLSGESIYLDDVEQLVIKTKGAFERSMLIQLLTNLLQELVTNVYLYEDQDIVENL